MRVIANEFKRDAFLRRVKLFCAQNDLQYTTLRDKPYWKIEGLFKIEVSLESVPVWNYGKWSDAFHFLFEEQFTIEWPDDTLIELCHYPAYNDLDSYFVVFWIPVIYFVPLPSKSIRH